MNNILSDKIITGVVNGTSNCTASFIGYVYSQRIYDSILFFTVASSNAVKFGLRRANVDTIKNVSGT